MASYQQMNYCKNCKKNVSLNDKGQCSTCQSTQLKKSWSVRFRFIEYGKEIQKRLTGFTTKKEAQNGYIDFVNQARLQQPIKKEEGVKFDQLFEEYKNFTKSRLKESSFYDFCSKSHLHILPYFKNYEVSELTPKILLDWQSSIDTYSYKYKKNLRMYLNTILNYAEKYYDIENKLKKVDNFRNTEFKKEMDFWTPEEFNKFIREVTKEEYKAFFYALYYTGARKGELLATTWNDWNFKKGTLNINKSVTYKVQGNTFSITNPKNQSSIREITLPPVLLNIMKEYKVGKENYDFVFHKDKPLPETSTKRIQTDACKKSGIKVIRLHDFRHSHASLLLSKGASVVAVAKRLGHANIEQTLNTYAHLMPKEEDLVLSILQKTAEDTV